VTGELVSVRYMVDDVDGGSRPLTSIGAARELLMAPPAPGRKGLG
jgi:hypothetical protein